MENVGEGGKRRILSEGEKERSLGRHTGIKRLHDARRLKGSR